MTTTSLPLEPRRISLSAHVLALVVAMICMAQFLIILDEVVVSIAIPSIGRQLEMASQALPWILNVYALCFGSLLLLGGRISDLMGSRRTFLFALAVFGLASLAGGLATGPTLLIAARAIQGAGAALAAPSALSQLTHIFSERAVRHRAFALWGATSAIGATSGMLAGGVLIGYFGWRFAFLISVPLAATAYLVIQRLLPAESRVATRLAWADFDIGGSITMCLGLFLLLAGIIATHDHGWAAWPTMASVALATSLLVCFVRMELRSPSPIVCFSAFHGRNVWGACVLSLVQYAGPLPIVFFFSIYLQDEVHYSAAQTGFMFLPLAVFGAVSSGNAMMVVKRFGTRSTVTLGFALMMLGHATALQLSSQARNAPFFVLLACGLVGTGVGLVGVPITASVVTTVEANYAGVASGLVAAAQKVGGALVLSILATVFNSFRLSGLPNGMHAAFLVSTPLLLTAMLSAKVLLAGQTRRTDVSPFPGRLR